MGRELSAFKRQLAHADCADSAAAAAHVVLFPERVFVAGESEPILVPFALTKPADKMRVFMVISAAGGRTSASRFRFREFMTTKQFSLGQVLSITVERLCCDMGGVYDILNHVTGDNLFTHVLPRASRFAKPLILQQYPELAAAGTDEQIASLDKRLAEQPRERAALMAVIKEWMASLGLAEHYDILSHADAWLSRNPVEELVSMVGKEKAVVVAP